MTSTLRLLEGSGSGSDDEGGSSSWFIGVMLALAGAFFAAVGDNLVKRSFSKYEEIAAVDPAARIPPVYLRPIWLAGMVCIIGINSGCSVLSLEFAEAYVVIPFAGVHIAFNLPLAYKINSEAIYKNDVIASALIFVGVIIVLVAGPKVSHTYDYGEVADLFKAFTGLAFCGVSLAVLPALYWGWKKHESSRVNRFCACVLSGAIGGCTNVILKGLVELFHGNDDHHWSKFGPYAIILASICLAVSQIIALNKTLEAYDAVYAVPVVNATLVIWGTFGGILLFQQYKNFDTFGMIGVPGGVLISAYGIVMLSKPRSPDTRPLFGIAKPPTAAAGADVERGGAFDRLVEDDSVADQHNAIEIPPSPSVASKGKRASFASDGESAAFFGRSSPTSRSSARKPRGASENSEPLLMSDEVEM